MKKEQIYVIGLIQLAMTGLLTYDFFPGVFAPMVIPETMTLVIIVTLVSTGIFYIRSKTNTLKDTVIWQITSTGYLFLLIMAFTWLGGISQAGISLRNPVIWIILAVSVNEIFQQKKRVKSSNSAIAD